MTWKAITADIKAMLDSSTDPELLTLWAALQSKVQGAAEPPYHLRQIVSMLEDLRGGRPRSEIRVLDHGCGGGWALIWLAAFGYTDVHGFDLGRDYTPHNRWARVALGHEGPRLAIYDGLRLPLPDQSIDAIISQQVLEHVPDAQLESYYSEEGRVLAAGGRALHQVPHRLGPYDSHSETWLVGMLPEQTADKVMRIFGRRWPHHVHLRLPSVHYQLAKRHIGPVRNLTPERLRGCDDLSYYDGAVGLRRAIGRACKLPMIGGALATAISTFVMLETLAIRER
jgi:SAM-dependent methyltransferase